VGCVNRFSGCRVRSGREGGTDSEFMESRGGGGGPKNFGNHCSNRMPVSITIHTSLTLRGTVSLDKLIFVQLAKWKLKIHY
jgi:hypothetical protein